MATNTTSMNYTPWSPSKTSTKPVAVGPVPTPVPPSGKVYTPQYPGGQTFTTFTPIPYTATPSGQNAVTQMQTSTSGGGGTQNGFNNDIFSKYYAGWDWGPAQADWTATGGSKAQQSSSGGGATIVSNTGNSGSSGTSGITSKQSNINQVSSTKCVEVEQDYANYADQMSPDQYYAMIDQEAGNSMNFLNQQEASIREEQPGIEKGITDQAAMLRDKALMGREDAQSAARRLYGELQQGYRQRFGGASSAGEAAMALTGNEQQRQMAQNNRTYQESVAQVDLSANQAVQSAQSEFRNQLMAINQNRTAVESERLAARRQALQDLSNKVFQIQQQRETFKQNIQLMQEQARIQNESNMKGMSVNPNTNLTLSGNQTTASGNQGLAGAIGYMGAGLSKTENPIGAGVYPIATMIDGRTKYSDGSVR